MLKKFFLVWLAVAALSAAACSRMNPVGPEGGGDKPPSDPNAKIFYRPIARLGPVSPLGSTFVQVSIEYYAPTGTQFSYALELSSGFVCTGATTSMGFNPEEAGCRNNVRGQPYAYPGDYSLSGTVPGFTPEHIDGVKVHVE